MKKVLAVLCVLAILILSACDNPSKTDTETTTTLLDNEGVNVEITTGETEKASTTNNTETTKGLSKTTEKSTVLEEEDIRDVPPYILTESIEDLKQIKYATETMSDADFSEFMKNYFSAETANGMDSIENAEKYLADFERAYVVYIDEFSEDNVLAYYIEYGDISYKVPVDDIFVITGSYYVNSEKTFEYKEGDIVKHLKTYEIDDMIIELYENTSNEKEGLYGNIRYDGVVIPFFTNVKISAELFESVLERIGIVKIGDLLNE